MNGESPLAGAPETSPGQGAQSEDSVQRGCDTVAFRCTNGRPCPEVSDRLTAVDVAVAAGIDSHHPALEQLRQLAAQWAELHEYGATS